MAWVFAATASAFFSSSSIFALNDSNGWAPTSDLPLMKNEGVPRAPIFPEVASALARIHGFASAEIVYPRGSGDPEADRTGQTEYALVATAPG